MGLPEKEFEFLSNTTKKRSASRQEESVAYQRYEATVRRILLAAPKTKDLFIMQSSQTRVERTELSTASTTTKDGAGEKG